MVGHIFPRATAKVLDQTFLFKQSGYTRWWSLGGQLVNNNPWKNGFSLTTKPEGLLCNRFPVFRVSRIFAATVGATLNMNLRH
jgi:hypothetical protein